jgi:2-polyprenyl-3-methyl-5-hydroxy-6-metoxy-1,4-benzoquinol methylase
MQRAALSSATSQETDQILRREVEYHEKLYSGMAQRHFARPAVRALRAGMVRRILAVTGAGPRSRVLSLGCGIGDTEILLAPHVAEVTGVDLSPAAIRQAAQDAARAGVTNARFELGPMDSARGPFDIVIAIFFLHHLPDALLAAAPATVAALLEPNGVLYSLDPSRRRLAGLAGALLIPNLMRRYQSPDERPLDPGQTAERFRAAGYDCRVDFYDFVSTPLAGVFPGWRAGYRAARALDHLLVRTPGLRQLSSNFEIIARRSN